MGTYTLGVDLSKYTEDQLWEHFPDEAAAEITRREGVTTTTPEVTTPETISMTPGLNELIEEIEAGGGKIPDDVLDIIDPLRNPTEAYGIPFLKTKFGELDPEKQGKKLSDKWFDLYNTYGMEPDDPNIDKIMDYLRSMRMAAESGKQISSSQYLMNQQKNLGITNPWLNAMPGVQVASMGNLTGMGIGNLLQQQAAAAKAAAAKAAAAKAAALAGGAAGASTSSGGGWQPDYSGAVASQQSQAAEAGQTHEQFMSDLDAVMAKGGLVSVNHLTRRL
jgi:hypothetical protein